MFFPKKSLNDLEKRYEHSHALFTSHDKTIIDRLALIANRNILYVTIHDDFDARYDKIKDEYLGPVNSAISSLRNMLESKNNKGFNSYYDPTRDMVTNFEKAVALLTRDLEKVMKPEEETRTLAYSIKEDVRKLKESYRLHQTELSLIEKSFDKLFNNIDASLNKVDELIEIADYQEASLLINKLKRLYRQVDGVIKEAPNLCVMIQRIVPEKMKALKEEGDRMVKQQYPLHHLMLNVTLDGIGDELVTLTNQMANLDINGIHERLRTSIDKIESFYGKFEIEKEAKVIFEKEYQDTYAIVNGIERQFIKLNSTLPQIRQYYVLADVDQQRVESIHQLISKMNMTKRGLDTLVLAATRQPYSLQVDIIKKLKEESDEATKKINEFNQYLTSLRATSEEAFHLVNVYYLKFKEGEHQLAELGIESIKQKILPQFDSFYDSLETISQTVQVLPIDIAVIIDEIRRLKEDGEALLEQINKEVKAARLAEGAIVQANRDRQRFTDYHRVLTMAETSYRAGNFQQAYIDAGNLLKKISTQLERNK